MTGGSGTGYDIEEEEELGLGEDIGLLCVGGGVSKMGGN